MQLSQKQNSFSRVFTDFLEIYIKFWIFWKKKMALINFVFSKLRTPKTESDKCLKIAASEDPSTSNMVNVPKHAWNLRHSTFMIFIEYC